MGADQPHLHSTMFLLNHNALTKDSKFTYNLHSTMFLLNLTSD